MHIAALAKVVPDYEVPSGDFELAGNRAHSRYTRMIGLYDENAVETGIQLKEKYGAELSIISYGSSDDVPILRKAIAMGADDLSIVQGDSDDPFVIAANLKMALEQMNDIDLVLAGQQSADLDRGVVHAILAEMLGCAFLAQISEIESQNGAWTVRQNHENGSRMLRLSGRAVFSITSSPQNVPRIPAVRAIMAAKKKPVGKLQGIEAPAMQAREVKVEIPKMESVCEFLSLDDLGQAAKTLLAKLREERYL
jgi:electron transfer flavoprotein beta subunit